jgi:hypothetical protein
VKPENECPLIGESSRRAIYIGLPAIPLSMLGCALSTSFERRVVSMVGERGLPYSIYGTVIVVAVISMVLYRFIPRRFVIPLGTIGWAISFALLYWWFCLGPGALRG